MNTSNRFKIFLWVILVVISGYVFYYRFQSLISENPNSIDLVMFIVFIGIFISPLFREISLFGFKYKTDFDNLRKDVTEQLLINKLELQSFISVSNSNVNSISLINESSPRDDSEIKELSERLNKTQNKAVNEDNESIASHIDDDIIYLFKIRHSFESLLRKHVWFVDEKVEKKYLSAIGKVKYLQHSDIVSQNVLSGVKEILAICNFAIHGKDITVTQLNFVKDTSTSLYNELQTELERSFD